MEDRGTEYVGFWMRVVATIIDSILIMLVTFPLMYLVYGGDYFMSGKFIQGPADFLISWVLPAVVVIWFWVSRGQTPGKMVIGAKVVDAESGELVSVGQGILRYVGYFVSAIVLLLGYIWVGIDARKRGWHDFIGRTVVVRK